MDGKTHHNQKRHDKISVNLYASQTAKQSQKAGGNAYIVKKRKKRNNAVLPRSNRLGDLSKCPGYIKGYSKNHSKNSADRLTSQLRSYGRSNAKKTDFPRP